MKEKIDPRLILEVVNYKVINTDQILKAIPKINNYEMLKEYYNFFFNGNFNIQHYENLDVILFAIKSRINILESKINLKEDLEKSQKINKGLERISLMDDLKEDNDYNNDMYYLKFINRDGSLTILEITDTRVLSNLITTVAPTMSADEFIKLLKTRYFKELPTFGLGKHEINILEYEHSSNIPDKQNYLIEKRILETDYPDIVPKVSIDSNNERLYHIDQIIIKFYDEDGTRKKNILSNEENKNDSKENVIEYSEHVKEDSSEVDITFNRNEIEDIEVEPAEAWHLLNIYSSAKSLEKSELLKVYAYLSEVLTKMELEQDITESEEYLLGISIDQIRKKEISRNNIEQEILNRYNSYYDKLDNTSRTMNASSKKKTYTSLPKSPLVLNEDGISLTITIITSTLLLGFLIAALLLVK